MNWRGLIIGLVLGFCLGAVITGTVFVDKGFSAYSADIAAIRARLVVINTEISNLQAQVANTPG